MIVDGLDECIVYSSPSLKGAPNPFMDDLRTVCSLVEDTPRDSKASITKLLFLSRIDGELGSGFAKKYPRLLIKDKDIIPSIKVMIRHDCNEIAEEKALAERSSRHCCSIVGGEIRPDVSNGGFHARVTANFDK